MADTQPAPAAHDGSLQGAAQAFMGLLEPEPEAPETETPEPQEAAPDDEEVVVESESEEEPEVEASAEEDEEEEDTEEELEDEEEEPVLYAVKVDGEEVEVPLDELLAGYSRQSAFTKRTQALAEQRRELESNKTNYDQAIAQIQNERQQYVDALNSVIQNSMSGMERFQNVNWESLREDDPLQYVTLKEEYREAQDKVAALRESQREAVEKQEADFRRQHEEQYNQEMAAMAEKLPEWADPDKQQKIVKDLGSYAESQGYQPEEIRTLIDHRSILVLRKAMLYDRMQSADLKTKKVKGKPRVVRSGKGAEKQQSAKKRARSKMQRLQQTGHIQDAAAMFEEFIA